jgi:hypothetical protein
MPYTHESRDIPLSHDLPCLRCGHATHTFLPCGENCACPPSVVPGSAPLAA